MDAETQAVIDAAQDTVNHPVIYESCEQARRLKSALQAHAKAHPPEPTTKGAKPEEAQGVYTFKVGDTVKIFSTLMGPDVGIVQKIQSPEDGGRVTVSYTVPGESRLRTCSYDAGDLTLLAPGNKPYAPDETTTGPMPEPLVPLVGGADMPTPPGYGPPGKREPIWGNIDRGAPNPQPMFAEFKPGDVCVLTYPRKLSSSEIDAIRKRWKEQAPSVQVIIEDSGPTISFLRPAKGGDDDAK